MTYPQSAPRGFYLAARRNKSGSLGRLLKLPTDAKVVTALAVAVPEWTEDECRQSMVHCVTQSKLLADRYFVGNEIIRSTYNRAKHGATMLHDESLTQREFWVLAPHLNVAGPHDKARYLFPKFTVDKPTIEGTVRSVEIAGELIRYLAILAGALMDADLLYPEAPAS